MGSFKWSVRLDSYNAKPINTYTGAVTWGEDGTTPPSVCVMPDSPRMRILNRQEEEEAAMTLSEIVWGLLDYAMSGGAMHFGSPANEFDCRLSDLRALEQFA